MGEWTVVRPRVKSPNWTAPRRHSVSASHRLDGPGTSSGIGDRWTRKKALRGESLSELAIQLLDLQQAPVRATSVMVGKTAQCAPSSTMLLEPALPASPVHSRQGTSVDLPDSPSDAVVHERHLLWTGRRTHRPSGSG